METTILEGEEYVILRYPGNAKLYRGIAESDTEAQERLEAYALHLRAILNVPYAVKLSIKKVN